jgi:hypothetical protein
MRGFWFQKKSVQLKTALRDVIIYFFQKIRVSARLLAKICVSQGYCYVVYIYYYCGASEKKKSRKLVFIKGMQQG